MQKVRLPHPHSAPTRILAIESSCDETACAIVERDPDNARVRVVSEHTATSIAHHVANKGIVPEVAAREQLKSILPVIHTTLSHAHIDLHLLHTQIDYLAVTTQPGLIGSLLVGVETVRTLGLHHDLPIIPVNHVAAHPYANFVSTTDTFVPPSFPALSWVISGGHTQLSLLRSHDDVLLLGETMDDAAGECFDKCARVLGYDYPGGPEIDRLAALAPLDANINPLFTLPRPLAHSRDFRLSFSGLKTAFARLYQQNKDGYPAEILHPPLAHALQQAIADVIVKKTILALRDYPEVQSILISGGAAANTGIRTALTALTNPHLHLYTPPLRWCTDNATMIGAYAAFHTDSAVSWRNIYASPHKRPL